MAKMEDQETVQSEGIRAQLEESSLPTPEISGSNQVLIKFYLLATNCIEEKVKK